MTMRTLHGLAAVLAFTLAGPAFAGKPDASIEKQLKALDLHYEIDSDGDFRLVFEAGDDGKRSQLVFVRSPVETYGNLRIREIWSPGYKATNGTFPAAVANRLLESSNDQKLGGWVKQDDYAIFVVKIDAAATPQQLRDAMEAATDGADTMEAELTPSKDEF